MKTIFAFWFLFCATSLFELQSAADEIVDKLQSISVTINSGWSRGSGVLFTREDGGHRRTFIWTAAHVIDGLRKTREIIVKGDTKTVVEFGDAAIVNEFREDDRRIGETKLDARVVRYSDARNGEDLAVLEVRKKDFVPLETSVDFCDDEPPPLGTELWHVGSLLGQQGSNSLTPGVMSQHGRVLDLGANGQVFDQSTCTAFPGSSGGGVFLKSDGRCCGLLVRGAGETFNLIVPTRRLRRWAKEAEVEWAMDRSVKLPDEKEMKKLPVEDSTGGIEFSHSETEEVEFPKLIYDL